MIVKIVGSDCAGGFDKFLVLLSHDRRSGHSRKTSQPGRRKRKQQVECTGTQRGYDGNGEHHRRDREKNVHDPHE
jgi:hypothetical protein